MKSRILTPIVFLFALLLTVSACRSNKIVRYPVPTNPTAKRMPPGQAKKLYGHQSAKAFAPGQQKKNLNSPAKGYKRNNGAKSKGK
jgi:hypothetical protein